MHLTPTQQDRAIGAVLASAAGDALGAPYEFQPSVGPDAEVVMRAGGSFDWELGEWTDDTSMALPILWALADGRRLGDEATLDGIVATWAAWSLQAKDVGNQTRQVLGQLHDRTAAQAREAARRVHESTGRSGGNGSLMRTGPVALGLLDDERGLAAAARGISDLTHLDPDAGDACVLWSLAIRHAIVTGELDLVAGLEAVPASRRESWRQRIDEGAERMPWDFPQNGWVVQALQAAWSAIVHADSLEARLDLAVRCGNDTDTVAAIAGALAGAASGATALPARWLEHLHGWAGERVGDRLDLERWARLAIGVQR